MQRSTGFLIYLILIHLALGGLGLLALGQVGPPIFLVEAGVLVSFVVGYRIYRSLALPQRLLGRGLDALRDQDFSVKLVPTQSEEVNQLVDVYNQMIDRLREERVVGRQREEFLDRLLQAAGIGVVICNYDGAAEQLNPWVERLAQQPEFDRRVLRPALMLRAGEQTVLVGADNRRYHVECATFIDRGFERRFLLFQDVTAELLTAEKEAYGRVIRMMAHEVNNSNAAILSVLRTLLEAAQDGDPTLASLNRDYLPTVINRAERLTTFMRNFAHVVRLDAPVLRRTDLADLLRQSCALYRSTLEEDDIDLRLELPGSSLWIEADPSQLEQVVLNALINARDSLREVPAEQRELVVSLTGLPARLTVADRGAGISAEVADRLFTPFFSSKPTGQGVGLTLMREVLEAHRAAYQLETEADGWTRLRIEFR